MAVSPGDSIFLRAAVLPWPLGSGANTGGGVVVQTSVQDLTTGAVTQSSSGQIRGGFQPPSVSSASVGISVDPGAGSIPDFGTVTWDQVTLNSGTGPQPISSYNQVVDGTLDPQVLRAWAGGTNIGSHLLVDTGTLGASGDAFQNVWKAAF